MLKAIRQNIVAWLALFVALTGTSVAASHYHHLHRPDQASVLGSCARGRSCGADWPAGQGRVVRGRRTEGRSWAQGRSRLQGELGPKGGSG